MAQRAGQVVRVAHQVLAEQAEQVVLRVQVAHQALAEQVEQVAHQAQVALRE